MLWRTFDLIFYVVCASILWILCLLLFPIFLTLKFNKRLQEIFTSFCINRVMVPRYGHILKKIKDDLFLELSETPTSKDQPLKILEIGAGEGGNFRYYPDHSFLTAVDVSESMKAYFMKNIESYPKVTLDRFIIGTAENMTEIPDESVDVVVSTFLLCSVCDVDSVLKEVKRVLVPGGKYYMVEHVTYPSDQYSHTIQKFVDPIWKVLFSGCHLTRNPKDLIMNAGFSSFSHWIAERWDLPLFFRLLLAGTVKK